MASKYKKNSVINSNGTTYDITYTSTTTSPYVFPEILVGKPSMKKVTKRSVLLDTTCSKCNKNINIGDVVLDQPVKLNELLHHITTHLDCLKKLVDKAPKPEYVETFEELRDRILETGKVFPDGPR